jgi:hypothetical protein
MPINHKTSESRNIFFPPCWYRSRRQGWPSNWSASAMRGAKSDGRRRANGIVVERRRIAMRGASSGRGAVMISSVVRSGDERWVREWVSRQTFGAWWRCAEKVGDSRARLRRRGTGQWERERGGRGENSGREHRKAYCWDGSFM